MTSPYRWVTLAGLLMLLVGGAKLTILGYHPAQFPLFVALVFIGLACVFLGERMKARD